MGAKLLSLGFSARHSSISWGQRVWNEHPLGAAMALGGSPLTVGMGFEKSMSMVKMEFRSALEYGWQALDQTSSHGRLSSTPPRYITMT